ncbi:MAG TPA: hypothetical protein VK796_02060, partial [Cytophaga sp.]|nr:hypothetical protein [Cytophaga sp.]
MYLSLFCCNVFGQLTKAEKLIEKGKYEKAEALMHKKNKKSYSFIENKIQKNTEKGNLKKVEKWMNERVHYTSNSSHKEDEKCKLPYRFYKRLRLEHEVFGQIRQTNGDIQQAEVELLKADSIYKFYPKGNFNLKRNAQELSRHYLRQLWLADLYTKLGDFPQAKKLIDETDGELKKSYELSYGKKHGAETSVANAAMRAYGYNYFFQQKYDSSNFYFEKYLILLVSDDRFIDHKMKEISDTYTMLAQSYLMSDRSEDAVKASRKAVKYCNHRFVKSTNGKNYLGKVNVYNTLSESYRVSLNYKDALKWNEKSYDIFQQHICSGSELFPILATRLKLYWVMGDTASSNKAVRELTGALFHYLQHNFPLLSEQERSFVFKNN